MTDKNLSVFIETAQHGFERVFERIEPENTEKTRELWNPENYINSVLSQPNMLPARMDDALSSIDAFVMQHVIAIACQADENALSKK